MLLVSWRLLLSPLWPNLRKIFKEQASVNNCSHSTFPRGRKLNTWKGIELGNALAFLLYFWCMCVKCVCYVFILMEYFCLKKKKSTKRKEALSTIANIAKPWGVIYSLLCDPEPNRGYASGDLLWIAWLFFSSLKLFKCYQTFKFGMKSLSKLVNVAEAQRWVTQHKEGPDLFRDLSTGNNDHFMW